MNDENIINPISEDNIDIDEKTDLVDIVESNKEIINTLESNDEGDVVIDPTKRDIYVEKLDPDVESLYSSYKKGRLILRPKYQRNFVIRSAKASKIIESILLKVPLPIFYFSEEADEKRSVIDGQQRLTAIFSYIDGNFPGETKSFKLTGLKVMTELNGKTFKELDETLQNRILTTALRVIVILKNSNPDLKFEIFERLNTGSTPLNEDEIRNTVYRGTLMDLLTELQENPVFNKLIDKPNFKNRMIYKGMILRFLAFYEKTYLKYKTNVKQFCNNFLEEYKNADNKKINEYRDIFKHSVDCVFSVFGKNAFRRLIKDEKNHYSWSNTRINMALFDIQMYSLAQYPKQKIISHLEEINEAMMDLMVSNQDFIDSIQIQTSNKSMVERRFKIWMEKLAEILKNDKVDPRFFSYKIKEELFNEDPTCKICKNRIFSIDDCHVDHIIPYSKDGRTIKENAQIAHRYCNLHKNDKS